MKPEPGPCTPSHTYRIGILLTILLVLLLVGVPAAMADTGGNGTKGSSAKMVYPYTGFRCYDQAPCFGGRLHCRLEGTVAGGRLDLVEIDWGDGSRNNTFMDPKDIEQTTHIYNKPRNYTVTITGYRWDHQGNREIYVGNYHFNLSLLKGDIIVHAIDKDSPYSSTLSPYVPGHWTHAAMYVGDDQVIESGWNSVRLSPVSEFVYPADECVAIFRVPDLTDTQRENIVNWAKEKLDDGYDLQSLLGFFSGKQQDNDDYPCWTELPWVASYIRCKWACSHYYCSELVWAAYRRNGIDFDPERGCVYPMDLVLSKHVQVQLVGTHIEKIPKRDKAYSTTDRYYMLLLNSDVGDIVKDIEKSGTCESCVGAMGTVADGNNDKKEGAGTPSARDLFDIRIKDPDGRFMTETDTMIPSSTAAELDIDGDNILEMMNSIENADEGEYLITVSPECRDPDNYVFSLRIGAWDNDQISWIQPVTFTGLRSLPDEGKVRMRIEENGYCRMIGIPLRGTAPLNVSFMDISPLMRSSEEWDYDDMVIDNTWDFGDGTTTTNTVTATHLYTQPGSYTVRLTTRNATREATATMKVTVDAPEQSLSAGFTASPLSGTSPLTVQFTDASTGDPIVHIYKFGDGALGNGKNPVHTYRKPGTYTVTLTVLGNDDAGRIQRNTTIKKDFITVVSQ